MRAGPGGGRDWRLGGASPFGNPDEWGVALCHLGDPPEPTPYSGPGLLNSELYFRGRPAGVPHLRLP